MVVFVVRCVRPRLDLSYAFFLLQKTSVCFLFFAGFFKGLAGGPKCGDACLVQVYHGTPHTQCHSLEILLTLHWSHVRAIQVIELRSLDLVASLAP